MEKETAVSAESNNLAVLVRYLSCISILHYIADDHTRLCRIYLQLSRIVFLHWSDSCCHDLHLRKLHISRLGTLLAYLLCPGSAHPADDPCRLEIFLCTYCLYYDHGIFFQFKYTDPQKNPLRCFYVCLSERAGYLEKGNCLCRLRSAVTLQCSSLFFNIFFSTLAFSMWHMLTTRNSWLPKPRSCNTTKSWSRWHLQML